MNAKTRYWLISVLLFCVSQFTLKSQSCGNCTVNVTGLDTLSYTITTGQTFCVDTSGIFSGSISLNGGTVCNKGVFSPKLFAASTGTVRNQMVMTLESSFSIGSAFYLKNEAHAIATIVGTLTVSGGTLNNAGITNVQNGLVVSSGTTINTAIINCWSLTGTGLNSISNSGIINKKSDQ